MWNALSEQEQAEAKPQLPSIRYAATPEETVGARKRYQTTFPPESQAVWTVVENWERLIHYQHFPDGTWRSLPSILWIHHPRW
ncbi:MAG: hypothetical protein MRJ67_01330 [Nitrospirales bacterium]|nr:hypothetical protein [Nitrospirales bacterium]